MKRFKIKNINVYLVSILFISFLLFESCISQTQNKPMMEQHKYTNHLVDQTSPYLLQHAHNPVNWYPWGEEALQKAKDENKMLLVSVGYSACHWCHVMEHESFEDEEVAQLMNAHFVCIKVDREERPDIDQIYMTAVQLMTGSGGWPLNCFALPDGRPFYGGTYFPKTRWMDILEKLAIEYKERPEKVEEYANRLTEGVIQSDVMIKNDQPKDFQLETLDEMVIRWKGSFDKLEGGGNRAPKFPLPNNYIFLMRYAALGHHQFVDEHVKLTLDKMAFGGIYDQIGGGFARYSTDKLWKVPHFEKMLYDNAQLISLYAEAHTRYRKDLYKQIADQSIAFCLRDLYKGDGIFYSALDADSEGEEGKYYVWKENELKQVLGDDYRLASLYYNIGQKADWEHGNNILLRNRPDEAILSELDLDKEDFEAGINRINKKLLEVREDRIAPGLDDKSLTSWNALMLKGLADAYIAFNEERYLEIAKQTAKFITRTQRKADGGLFHNYKNGTSNINGYLEDYSFTIEALVRMYEATFDRHWLNEADALTQYVMAHFYDTESGMFYFTSDLDPSLVARKMELNDNVIPASNSSMANALFLLGTILDNQDYLEKSQVMLNNIKLQMVEYGSGYSNWGNLMLKEIYPLYEIAIVGSNSQEKRIQMEQYYIPNKIVLGSTKRSDLALLDGKYVDGETLYYVCVNKACQLPTSEISEALKQIK